MFAGLLHSEVSFAFPSPQNSVFLNLFSGSFRQRRETWGEGDLRKRCLGGMTSVGISLLVFIITGFAKILGDCPPSCFWLVTFSLPGGVLRMN